jgi:prepilin peptidase CpaA
LEIEMDLPGLVIPPAVVIVASGIATVTDVTRFRVANALTLPLLASGLVYHLAVGGWTGLLASFVGALFGFAALVWLYAIGGMGAGDVKFMAGVGAWLGMPMAREVLIAAALVGGVYALVAVIATGRLAETACRMGRILGWETAPPSEPVQDLVHHRNRRGRLVPFAAMIAAGLVITIVGR